MYLDCDTTPPLTSRYIAVKRVDTAVEAAMLYIADAEGQIGIYDNHMGDGFKGYVIRYSGNVPEFEPAVQE